MKIIRVFILMLLALQLRAQNTYVVKVNYMTDVKRSASDLRVHEVNEFDVKTGRVVKITKYLVGHANNRSKYMENHRRKLDGIGGIIQEVLVNKDREIVYSQYGLGNPLVSVKAVKGMIIEIWTYR